MGESLMGPSQILHALKICQDALRSQAASEQKYMKYQGRVKQPQRELQCSGKDIMWHIIIINYICIIYLSNSWFPLCIHLIICTIWCTCMYRVYLPPVYTVFPFNSWLQDIRPGSSCRFGVQRTLRCPIMAVLIALTSLGRIMRISSAWKAMKPKVCWLKRRIAFIPLREDFIRNCFQWWIWKCCHWWPWTLDEKSWKIRRTLTQGTATGIQLPTWMGTMHKHPDGF